MRHFEDPYSIWDALTPGSELIDRYVIEKMITGKTFSRMYKGINRKSEKEVAIKELILDESVMTSMKGQVIKQFQIETKILLSLLHPNLPKFEDNFEIESRRYLVMEYIHGEKLEDLVSKKQRFVDHEVVIDWSLQLCDALEYLHSRKPRPIIFRSLSPENVILTNEGNLKLINFGISKIFDPAGSTLPIAKTAHKYYSPMEQTVGRTDERTDIYSLGATLYFLLTKNPPTASTQRAITRKPLPSCRNINPRVSTILERIVFRATEIDPENRYQDIESLKNALLKLKRKPTAKRKSSTEELAKKAPVKVEDTDILREEIFAREASKQFPRFDEDEQAIEELTAIAEHKKKVAKAPTKGVFASVLGGVLNFLKEGK